MGVLLVSGCGSSQAPDLAARCPRVSLLADAATLTQFAPGPGRDLTDVDYQAEFTDVQADCQVMGGRGNGQIVVVTVAPVMTVVRGPANNDRQADLSYLVSVIGLDQSILNVQRFPIAVSFPGNLTRLSVIDNDPPVTVRIPLTEGTTGRQYDILVGFQLTPDELEYNRRRDGQTR